jgi:hypothetical protein
MRCLAATPPHMPQIGSAHFVPPTKVSCVRPPNDARERAYMANSNMLSKLAATVRASRRSIREVQRRYLDARAPGTARSIRSPPLASTVLPKKIVRTEFRIVAASAHATHIGLREIIALEEQGFA